MKALEAEETKKLNPKKREPVKKNKLSKAEKKILDLANALQMVDTYFMQTQVLQSMQNPYFHGNIYPPHPAPLCPYPSPYSFGYSSQQQLPNFLEQGLVGHSLPSQQLVTNCREPMVPRDPSYSSTSRIGND